MAHRKHHSRLRYSREGSRDDSHVTYVYYNDGFDGNNVRSTPLRRGIHEPLYLTQSMYDGGPYDDSVADRVQVSRINTQTLPSASRTKYVIKSDSPRDIIRHQTAVTRSVSSADGRIYTIRDQVPKTLDSLRSKPRRHPIEATTHLTLNLGPHATVIPVTNTVPAQHKEPEITVTGIHVEDAGTDETDEDVEVKVYPDKHLHEHQKTKTPLKLRVSKPDISLPVSEELITSSTLSNIKRVSVESQTSFQEKDENGAKYIEPEIHNDTDVQTEARETTGEMCTQPPPVIQVHIPSSNDSVSTSVELSHQEQKEETKETESIQERLVREASFTLPTKQLPKTSYPQYQAAFRKPWYFRCLFGRGKVPNFKKYPTYWISLLIIVLIIVGVILVPPIHFATR